MTQYQIDTVSEAAAAVIRNGAKSARFHDFKTLAARQGYQSGPGGYIRNAATGGTVAHGWRQFAEHVLARRIPLQSATELDREAYDNAWADASEDAKRHPHVRAAADCASRGDWVRALSWLTEAVAETVKPGDRAEWTGVEPVIGTVVGTTDHTVTLAWINKETGQTGVDKPTRREFADSYRLISPARSETTFEITDKGRAALTVSVDPGRTVGYAVHGLPRSDGSHAVWGLPNAVVAGTTGRGKNPAVMSCPRECGVDIREHRSSDLLPGGYCDTGTGREMSDAREAYAHNLYATAVTTPMIGAGYADWDNGDPSPYEVGQCRKTAIERRLVLAALETLPGDKVPGDVTEAYATGRFSEALRLLTAGRPLVCLRVDGPHVGHMRAVAAECREGGSLDAADTESEALSAKF